MPATEDQRRLVLRASDEQRRLAGAIAIRTRWNPADPELPVLRERLSQLRVRRIWIWALLAMHQLPATAEIARVTAEARKVDSATGQAGGDAE